MREEAADAHVIDIAPPRAVAEKRRELVEVGRIRLDRVLRRVDRAQRIQEFINSLLDLAALLLSHGSSPRLLCAYARADDAPCKPSSAGRAQDAYRPG